MTHTPYQYMLDYNGHTIHCLNGLYTVADLPRLPVLSMNEAKAQIDAYEAERLRKLFENQKSTNAETTNAEG